MEVLVIWLYMTWSITQMAMAWDGNQCQHMIRLSKMLQTMRLQPSSRDLTRFLLMSFLRYFMQMLRYLPDIWWMIIFNFFITVSLFLSNIGLLNLLYAVQFPPKEVRWLIWIWFIQRCLQIFKYLSNRICATSCPTLLLLVGYFWKSFDMELWYFIVPFFLYLVIYTWDIRMTWYCELLGLCSIFPLMSIEESTLWHSFLWVCCSI